ncbi:aminotransferase class IV [Marinilongibacter aquaticus]|uniref:aminotransferase class IV n=1 Tax=Marinilongibacter aquaticus TaxID=2975157 RepID=UPI0021BDD560|nr:aminotransferase class IV [Marinilongibacter aquaticus]UBM60321.1 aminotransferase class IV [Marinilongibacter aquaticus]
MSHFFETINCRDGQLYLLDYHQERVNRTFRAQFPQANPFRLSPLLESQIPNQDWFRCRVSYDSLKQKVEFIPYRLAEHQSLQLVEVADFTYPFKSENRSFFNDAVASSPCSDVLFTQNGFLTDSSYANVCLLENGVWYTPEKPLLLGVKRQFLLDQEKIKTRSIHCDDLARYEKIALINALRDFERVYAFTLKDRVLYLQKAANWTD